MKVILTALALALAGPAFAQAGHPHAAHKADSAAPAAPAHADHDPAKKGCCEEKQNDCCHDMEGKGCCADKAKSGTDAGAGHHSH